MPRSDRKNQFDGKEGKEAFLVEGAKKEGEVMLYGSSQASEFNEMIKAFNTRYPFIKGNYFRGQRYGLINRVELEWKTKKYTVDIIQSVLYRAPSCWTEKDWSAVSFPERAAYNRFIMPRTARGTVIEPSSRRSSTIRPCQS
jgi:hypothetical protein